jgi:hypothetical protein
MITRFAANAALLASVAALAACGADVASAPATPATEPSAPAAVAEPAPSYAPPPAEAAPAAVVTPASCPDDGPRLPLSGVCVGRATNYMDLTNGPSYLPEGCTWVPQETEFAGEVLLYLAASCDGRTAKLAFAGGARFAELSVETSAIAPGSAEGEILVRVGSVIDGAPGQAALANAREAYAAEGASPEAVAACRVRPSGLDFWPEGAFVIDDWPEGQPEPEGEIRTACGPFGLDQDSARYWREAHGFSWFYDLGQDVVDFDPQSLTIVPAAGAAAP